MFSSPPVAASFQTEAKQKLEVSLMTMNFAVISHRAAPSIEAP